MQAMRKLSAIISGVCFLFLATAASAQSKLGADYFAGKWNILVKGTPNGDSKMIVSLDKKDTSMTGVILDTTGKEITKISSLVLKDSTITVNFTAQGYDVYLILNRKDDDHVTGTLMDMFESEGDRIKNMK
jgi:hypothetical protein